ncbi:uncharacterized protein JCM15063_004819 [Sporobolomyces koalae]|uniref:uncharacterized protein n=1 Tax=Sporobolomyces koalae TaxID=500713 RepID=UPI00317B9679
MAKLNNALRFDTTFGPAPSVVARYSKAEGFVRFCRSYQWTQGYDVAVVPESSPASPIARLTIQCSTHDTCSFSVSIVRHLFDSEDDHPTIRGKWGYRVSGSNRTVDSLPFQPVHNHEPPYEPLDVDAENARRAQLSKDDHTLNHPPLVARQRIAPPSMKAEVDRDSDKKRKRIQSTEGERSDGQVRTWIRDVETSRNSNDSASSKAPQLSLTNRQTPTSLSPKPDAAPTTRVSSSASVPPPSIAPGRAGSTLCQTPLAKFLLDISPSFETYLPLFPKNGYPLETTGAGLLDIFFPPGDPIPSQDRIGLDEEEDSIDDLDKNHEICKLLEDVRGLPPFLIIVALDGIKKAQRRRIEARRQAATSDGAGIAGTEEGVIDPRIAVGLKKRQMENFVRQKIREGEQQQVVRP